MRFQVRVDKENCKGCEECMKVCTVEVFEMQGGKPVPINDKECLGCESCVQSCEEKALAVIKAAPDLSETARSLLREIL
jgi:NAD-dependent dihydropyrimidine dehydrogenase PreA subunit